MTTARELRQHCERLTSKRKEELKSALNDYFYSTFIVAHRPFRAIIGNKRCKPIPIHQSFMAFSEETFLNCKIKWPNISEELIRKELENLGFIVTKNKISISVPPYKKGTELSFAQKWVKIINTSYSDYCATEKKAANELYSELISALYSVPVESIKTFEGYTLFCDFKFNRKISPKCATFIRRLLLHDGIEEYYENGEYKGIKVYNSLIN